MKLAFLITAHDDVRHLRDLVESLPEGSEFYIHVDKKRSLTHFQQNLKGDDVHFISRRVDVVPDSLSEVAVQIELLRSAMDNDVDYLIAIDESDYPLWSNNHIIDVLSKADGKQFINGIAMPGQGKAAYKYTDFQPLTGHHFAKGSFKSRVRSAVRMMLSQSHVHKTLRIYSTEKTYTLYKGSTSWAITPQLASAIVEAWDSNERLRQYFCTSYRPVETFVPTVAFNSEFADKCNCIKGRYEDMEQLMSLTFSVGHTPKILTETDFRDASESGKMFCRRIVAGYSDGIKSLIDASRKGQNTVKNVIG